MKIILRLFILVCFILPLGLRAQTLWPFGIPGFILPTCDKMASPTSCTKTARSGNYDDPNIWTPVGVPRQDAIVCIPEGVTVTVRGGNTSPYGNLTQSCTDVYTNTFNNPRIAIYICGRLEFEQGGKLNLGCGSVIQIFAPNGRLISAQGNSDIISIGSTAVWGQNNSTVPGPAFVHLCPNPSQTGSCVSNGVLSVVFKSFEAKLQGPYQALLQWTTSSEFNSKEFTVEKSIDAQNWTPFRTIPAKGNSTTESFYSITDQQLTTGTTYYRLKQRNTSGNTDYSNVISVNARANGKLTVYPNPAGANATLYTSDVIGRNQDIQLYNMNGAFIQTLSSNGSNVLHFGTSHLSPGLYLIRIVENGKTIAETKLIKQ
jgi:hypothetical protein